MLRASILALLLLIPTTSALAQKNFGFDNRKSSGQPYLDPQETVKRFQALPGWEVSLVAGEPDVINPVAFTIDEKGRIWVVECFEYPSRTPKGKKPRDRIKIIEETPNGPKVTIWAEGKDLPIGWDLATGIEVGNGGVYLGAPPYLFFLKDTKNQGKCDHQEVLLKGFGSQDTHETLNTFMWGPDSKLWGLHGIYTQSEVEGIKLNAAVWRYDVNTKKFDIFAEGTSNPWGMDFDRNGNCFLACCVIPHLFHMVPGGHYKRQGGVSFNNHAYGLLNEISDHLHHKESGWAHAGLLALDGPHVPESLQGSLLMGSIHGCSIKRDTLRKNGSTFIGSHAPDFLGAGDKNVRPINMRWGPDGSIYLIDWHDQNPCHQAAPDSWDQTRGRIYKIRNKKMDIPVGELDLNKASNEDLAQLAIGSTIGSQPNAHFTNPWWQRTAHRVLVERKPANMAPYILGGNLAHLMADPTAEIRALWLLYGLGAADDALLERFLKSRNPDARSWAIRFLGEKGQISDALLEKCVALAKDDAAPKVRLELSSLAQKLRKQNMQPLLHTLMSRKEDARDVMIPLMLWLAYEPGVVSSKASALDWLRDHAVSNELVTNDIVPRALRRLASTNEPSDLDAAVRFLGEVRDSTVRLRGMEGLQAALKTRQVPQPASWRETLAILVKDVNPDVGVQARRLAIHFADPQAIARAAALAVDATQKLAIRLEAIRDLALAHPPEGLKILQNLVLAEGPLELRQEACRGLAAYDNPAIAEAMLKSWKTFPPALRGEAVNLLAGRKDWAKNLLTAIGQGSVPRTDLNDNVILRLNAFKDAGLKEMIEKHWGRFRDTPKELNALIDKMRVELAEGPASFERGKKVFETNCAKCHKFDGKGFDVGPNLDGAARDFDYLLINILDPNRVVGQPYYVRLVELKNGRIETGLLAAEDEQSITLKQENNVLKVIAKNDIEGKVVIQEKSVMPEGLANNMTPQDFRDLVRYALAHPFISEVEAGSDASLKPHSAGLSGRIVLGGSDNPVSLVRAKLVATESARTKLLIGGNRDITVRIDGVEHYKGQPGKDAYPDQVSRDLELSPGPHQIEIRVAPGSAGAMYLRFHDPDRKLRYPE